MASLKAFVASVLLLLAAHGVGAQDYLQVNLNSGDSIRSAAKTVARNLMEYYKGDEPGQTIGILPGPPPQGPYYWWQAGAMFGTLIDYWHYTGDDTYNGETATAMVFQAEAPANSYMPRNWTASLGNDDQGFWGMAAMLAAEVGFPNPPKDQPQWLALAQAVFNTQAARWEHEDCAGGLHWQIPPTNGGYNYKNTVANVVFLNLAARLARYTKNETYAEWAEKAYDWTSGVGYIDKDYNVFDGGHVEANCTDINLVQFSANAAVLLHATASMYNHTNDQRWRARVQGLLNRTTEHFFPNGIMVERACELEDRVQCNVDQHSFKGYMHRALATVSVLAPFTRDDILPLLKTSAKGAMSSCLSDGTCGFRWNVGGYDGDAANGPAGQEMSALAALSTLLVDERFAAPLTNGTGGTSVGDPNAGGNTKELDELTPVTTGDRGGAGVLTAFLLASTVGCLVWISGPWGEA
ncbi:glycosyl hydrolase family 76-domain-containing protein [Lasiosphaeria hispida]|uniref:Mannan endo-1,6-alpha-mannosidase n=1 Tax=Lasiosphaeria hispida TaxID=260671 RepID=A0AAJ0HBE3_9PEZI|nr:glycosyl hydrolase family 76-domain-containing protein [Lasiosphaeria hispida]